MAKKQAANPDEAPATPTAAAAAPAGEGKKPKEAKAKTKPDAPAAAAAPPAAAPADGAPAAAAPAPTQCVSTKAKRKGKQPGKPHRRGKKLLNRIKNEFQKVAKEGSVPLKRAIQLLKQLKRAKFDETVEVDMSLGIDTTQSDQMIRGSVPL